MQRQVVKRIQCKTVHSRVKYAYIMQIIFSWQILTNINMSRLVCLLLFLLRERE